MSGALFNSYIEFELQWNLIHLYIISMYKNETLKCLRFVFLSRVVYLLTITVQKKQCKHWKSIFQQGK